MMLDINTYNSLVSPILHVPTVTSCEVGRVCHSTLRDFELAPNRRGAIEVTSSGALLVRSKSTKQLSTPPEAKLRFLSGFSFEKSDPWSLDDSMSYESGDRSGRGYRFCGRPRDPRREGGRKEKKAAPLCGSSVRPLSDLVSGVTFAGSGECRRVLYLTTP